MKALNFFFFIIMVNTILFMAPALGALLPPPDQSPQNIHKQVYAAINGGKRDKVEALLKANADINFANNKGVTFLHKAAYHSKPTIVQLLIAAKALINCKDSAGDAPLHDAARNGHQQII